MTLPKVRHGLFALVVATAGLTALAAPGCYVEEPGPVYAVGYQPSYYDGYVVYYDGGGRPFYYEGGRPLFVPVGSPYYGGLVAHYRTYGGAYAGWNARYGVRYRGYRAGGGGRRR